MKKANLIVSGIIAIIAIVIIVVSAGYPRAEAYGTGAPGPGLWPICISVVMLLMAILLAVQTLRGKSDAKDAESNFTLVSADHLRVYISMAAMILYVALLKPLGFLLPTFIMSTLFIHWFSKESDPAYVARKAKSAFGMKVYEVFDIADGKKQSRPLWLCAVIGLIATFAVYFAFKLGLNVPMNFGLLYI
ncbi:MAG: tripartite tricarboxylate transporter TctB family protein [Sphaerochaetaceae bacterium]|jgi:putative tricarboxylic transport membrane protein|nr:tripartite tricarboxylate transporter TctB family protein [Sphaerochaetaceae bacterium]